MKPKKKNVIKITIVCEIVKGEAEISYKVEAEPGYSFYQIAGILEGVKFHMAGREEIYKKEKKNETKN